MCGGVCVGGGAGLVNFISFNLLGPEICCVFCWRKDKAVTLTGGISQQNFKVISEIIEYTKANQCSFQNGSSSIEHVEWCNQITQEWGTVVNFNLDCVRRGCYIVKGTT